MSFNPARRLLLALASCCAGFAAHAADSVPAGWFVWPALEPVAGSALDASALNTARGAALPRIGVKAGRFVTPDGHRIRFWATNVSANEAFPASAEEAAALARRFAKAGVNLVRLHHLDNPWGVGNGGSLWPAGRPDHAELDPVQLDRLHRLIAAFRDEGIYCNLNLKVSKQLAPEDGFDPSVTQLGNFNKRVDIFDRRMIDLQKDYARRLLTTKNPYTGYAPAEDPAIAVVEINNENSLLGFWTRDLGRGLEKLPAPFREDLRTQWNGWLARRYADDAAHAAAWAPPAGGMAEENQIPANTSWKIKVQPGSAATLAPSADGVVQEIRVTAASGIDWHVQTSLAGLTLQDGAVYTIEFLGKASEPRKLGVGVGIDALARPHDPWRSFGLLDSVALGTDWQVIRLSFPAHSVAGAPAALSFNAGHGPGTVFIKDLKLRLGAPGAGLQPGQSARAGSVPLPLTPSAKQWADWIHFLVDTERAFADEMRGYLRDELKVDKPIACSQVDYGGLTGLHREQPMEFADVHAYWQHPDFPAGTDWDATRYTIRNSPQLADFKDRAFGELGNLALVRVAGKPFTVSEYDHPAPSEFVCEMYPEIASFAARQDWDIVYTFSIGAYGSANPDGSIRDFFDQLHHPAKWSQSVFASLLFRRGLVAAAPAVNELALGNPLWAEQPHAEVLWRQLVPKGPLNFLNVRYAVSDQTGAAGTKARLIRRSPSGPAPVPVRLGSATQGRVYVIDAEQVAAAVGFVGGGKVDAGPLHVLCDRFGRDFASITAVALDGNPLRESERILITAVARASNQGAQWNDAHNSLGANWGHGPTLAEHVPATITLAGAAGRKVFALGPDGARVKEVETGSDNGALTFSTATHQTLHYEVVPR